MGRARLIAVLLTAAVLSVVPLGPAFAAKDVFIRTKPHVNVGSLGDEPVQFWLHANAGVFADGGAVGILQLRVLDGDSFLYRVTSGRAVVERGAVLELDLVVERVGEDGTPTGMSDVAIVRPCSTAEDCLIYDLLGANIHVETRGRLVLRHPGAN